jgi:endonuclease/exonuclease/phosphatase family metal-dependent hydrolase
MRVITFNLLNDATHWEARAPLIVEGLRALQPEVIAFQEVRLPADNAAWIAERLDGYATFLCPKTGPRGLTEGEALLSRLPVEDHAVLAFGRQGRVAHRITVRTSAGPCVIGNAHLFFSAFNDVTRRFQVQRLLGWLPEGMPTVVCGDFNAEPSYSSVGLMRQRFRSAYAVVHGTEPAYTCPTLLDRGPGIRHSVRRAALRLLGWILRPGQPSWQGTLDYIFVSPEVQVRDCTLVLDRPSPSDPRIYPSDHMGLMATLALPMGAAA